MFYVRRIDGELPSKKLNVDLSNIERMNIKRNKLIIYLKTPKAIEVSLSDIKEYERKIAPFALILVPSSQTYQQAD